jgi:hypothetical protein
MKALTIRQPWASLIADNIKLIESRSWQTHYRGKLYIHAGKGIDKKYLKDYENIIDITDMPKGKIIAECNLIDCILLDKKYIDYYNKLNKSKEYKLKDSCVGYYGWVLSDIKKIKEIEIKGKLSIWDFEGR